MENHRALFPNVNTYQSPISPPPALMLVNKKVENEGVSVFEKNKASANQF
jgi:hypothetical protein